MIKKPYDDKILETKAFKKAVANFNARKKSSPAAPIDRNIIATTARELFERLKVIAGPKYRLVELVFAGNGDASASLQGDMNHDGELCSFVYFDLMSNRWLDTHQLHFAIAHELGHVVAEHVYKHKKSRKVADNFYSVDETEILATLNGARLLFLAGYSKAFVSRCVLYADGNHFNFKDPVDVARYVTHTSELHPSKEVFDIYSSQYITELYSKPYRQVPEVLKMPKLKKEK